MQGKYIHKYTKEIMEELKMKRLLTVLLFIMPMASVWAWSGYDDISTDGINEGAIGKYDDITTQA